MTALKKKKPPPPESILSSTVGFYAAHATMLAAAIIGRLTGVCNSDFTIDSVSPYKAHTSILASDNIILYPGTPLGEKATEISQKVATDTAEELKKAAAAYEGDIPGN